MSNNLRNSQLLGQVRAHPLRSTLAKCLDISEAFERDVQHLQLDRRLSAEGRADAMQSKLRSAIRDLRDARAPLIELQTKLDARRAAVAMPPTDPKDIVGFLRRQELRSALRTMNAGQRELTLNDPAFADAMLEQPAVLSGLFLAEDFQGTISAEIQRDRDIVAAAKQKRLENLFAPQLAEIDELEKTVAEAKMIADIARNDLKLHSAMDDRVFAEFVKPVEAKRNAPWLKRGKDASGADVIYVLVPDGPGWRGKPATPDEERDGRFFKDHSEYLASRAA